MRNSAGQYPDFRRKIQEKISRILAEHFNGIPATSMVRVSTVYRRDRQKSKNPNMIKNYKNI
jgi:hypothetical protein